MPGPSLSIRTECPIATPDNDGLMSKDQAAKVAAGGGASIWNIPPVQTGGSTFAASANDLVRCDASGGNVTVNLPSAVGVKGKSIAVKLVANPGVNSVTIAAVGGETIDGAPSVSINKPSNAGGTFTSDGANYVISSTAFL